MKELEHPLLKAAAGSVARYIVLFLYGLFGFEKVEQHVSHDAAIVGLILMGIVALIWSTIVKRRLLRAEPPPPKP